MCVEQAVARIKQPSARYLLEKGPSQKQLNVNSPTSPRGGPLSPRAGPQTPRSPAGASSLSLGASPRSANSPRSTPRKLNFDSALASPSAADSKQTTPQSSAKSVTSPSNAATGSAASGQHASRHGHHHHNHSHSHRHARTERSPAGNGNSSSGGSSDEPSLSQADDEALLLARLRGLPTKAAGGALSPTAASADGGKASSPSVSIKHAGRNKPASNEELSVSHNAAVWSERSPWHGRFGSLVTTLGIVRCVRHIRAAAGIDLHTGCSAARSMFLQLPANPRRVPTRWSAIGSTR